MDIDAVVVISLPHRVDRLKLFFRELPLGWPFPRPRVVAGVIAQPPPYWKGPAGAYGCAQAHVDIIREAYRRGVKSLAVFEDDAVFTENFAMRWKSFAKKVPDDWSVLQLGGQHLVEPTWRQGNVVRCIDTRRTHGYIIRDRAMPAVIRSWSSASTHIDHSLPKLAKTMPIYAPHPWMVGQRAGLSDITGGVNASERFWINGPYQERLGKVSAPIPGPGTQHLHISVHQFDVDVADVAP